MSCEDLRSYLEAFVDGELSPERTLEVQAHLRHCQSCQAEVELTRAVVRTTRRSADQVCLCPQFEARLRGSLAAECKKLDGDEPHRPLGWKSIGSLSAAAAAVLSLGFVAAERSPWFAKNQPSAQPLTQASSAENMMDFLVQHHTKTTGPEFRDVSAVDRMEPELGFPVHAPAFDHYGARFVGASLVHVNQMNAASLHYVLGGRRFTLYVYNPDQMPLRSTRSMHATVIGDNAVFVGHRRGYSVATCEKEGLGYTVAADLTDRESAELVAAVGR